MFKEGDLGTKELTNVCPAKDLLVFHVAAPMLHHGDMKNKKIDTSL